MTIEDRDFDKAVRKAMRKHELNVDEHREGENSYLLSNDCCLLDIYEVSERVYSVCASLIDNSMLRDKCGVDPYRFYQRMIEKIPFFSIKMEEKGMIYSVITTSPSDMEADIGECILVSKMFNATFDDVIHELNGRPC